MMQDADLDFFYQCGAFTAPLVKSNQLVMALNSWVLDSVLSTDQWDPNSDSMLRFHESSKHSAEVYNKIIMPVIVPVSAFRGARAAMPYPQCCFSLCKWTIRQDSLPAENAQRPKDQPHGEVDVCLRRELGLGGIKPGEPYLLDS